MESLFRLIVDAIAAAMKLRVLTLVVEPIDKAPVDEMDAAREAALKRTEGDPK